MNQYSHFGLSIAECIACALKEDYGDGDHTSLATIPEGNTAKAVVKVKEAGIIAGLVVADQVLNQVDHRFLVKTLMNEGDKVETGDPVMSIEGPVHSLLQAERLLLNFMQRMSGIATHTRRFVDAVQGTQTIILDTRKTTPNFRVFEKWAVRLGGGQNHRFGLYDMILIKDNHVDASGGIEAALKNTHAYLKKCRKNIPVEIETRNLEEVNKVLQIGGIQRIMLDNFNLDELKKAVDLIEGKYETEASGGIHLDNVRAYAASGVNYISVGALTHSSRSMDISMKIVK